jgi:3-deoxy-D-manno-octulosonate 8-phosphate phosphatase (KDO 8-P phosphatase)
MAERRQPLNLTSVAPLVIERAADVELLILDVDGVLTDGRLYYGEQGEMMKALDTRDGHGIVMLRHAGIRTAILSGRPQKLLARRFAELQVVHVEERSFAKGEAIVAIAEKLEVALSSIAYVGDDVNDIAAMEKAGLSACPVDAAPETRAAAMYVSSREGGRGAVREVCELILKAKDRWPTG